MKSIWCKRKANPKGLTNHQGEEVLCMENMEQLFSMIANIGFPIVISIYLLVRIENRMISLTQSIRAHIEAIRKMK